MVWIDILLAVVIYCAAVFGLMCFSDLPFEGAFDFVSLPRSLFAVLSVAIAAEWTVIVTPVVVKLWWGGFVWFLFSFCGPEGCSHYRKISCFLKFAR